LEYIKIYKENLIEISKMKDLWKYAGLVGMGLVAGCGTSQTNVSQQIQEPVRPVSLWITDSQNNAHEYLLMGGEKMADELVSFAYDIGLAEGGTTTNGLPIVPDVKSGSFVRDYILPMTCGRGDRKVLWPGFSNVTTRARAEIGGSLPSIEETTAGRIQRAKGVEYFRNRDIRVR
jgi:hypothetical protein